MKFCNILVNGETHLAAVNGDSLCDLWPLSISDVLSSGRLPEISGPIFKDEPVFANVVVPNKLLCVGLNYTAHADNVKNIGFKTADSPILFSKFANALAPANAEVELPPWETSYDYEAELVIVIGKTAWNIEEKDAKDYIFGYTCGNDFSLRDAQRKTSQWLIGKSMPGFGPCGPYIVTADEFDPDEGKNIRSYVNGELRQNGSTADMIHSCAEIVAYASKYIRLEPGDLIFTGTPSGVAMEKDEKHWLKSGDVVDVVIEGIGTLRNTMK